jgi:hypothetical protein
MLGVCRAVSLKTVAGKLAKYKFDVMAVQEVRWDTPGSEPADDQASFCENGNSNHNLGTGFFIHKGIIAVRG